MTHTCVFAKGQSKITRQSWLIVILCHPVFFTAALLLVLEITYVTMCNLSWWVPCVDQPQKHNPSHWLGAMPINVCFFFCLLNEMCYFALSLLTHTFLKQQIMWMFTVYGLGFFSATLQENKTTCGHFNWYKIKHNNFTDSAMIDPVKNTRDWQQELKLRWGRRVLGEKT